MGPETNAENLEADPSNNLIIYDAVKQMDYGNWKVQFLNITYLTEIRKDGHPSKYREPGTPPLAPQDCSHWCLPHNWNKFLDFDCTLSRIDYHLASSSTFSSELSSPVSNSFTFSSCLKRSNLSGPYVEGIRAGTYL